MLRLEAIVEILAAGSCFADPFGQVIPASGLSRPNCDVRISPEEEFPGLYTWFMSAEQEQLLCDALVSIGPLETEQGLHAEGVRKIQEVLHCTLDEARMALRELRLRQRIEETTTSIGQPDQPHFRWVKPAA